MYKEKNFGWNTKNVKPVLSWKKKKYLPSLYNTEGKKIKWILQTARNEKKRSQLINKLQIIISLMWVKNINECI